eukprot:CAMPEP_0185279730 /NCGR_PEP_ID=MMETSP1359-20130426/64223_1 /TAXON_ID=552665 /ORGANISM="Bigelowiella longifila, Strain CCMP242" /LENGTH=118 /DNA_ID=CAMNT_0027874683 /DNA_START=9 /DNA_END=365 /DNA_ORIENTATION=+
MIAYASRYDGEAPPCEIWGDMTDEPRSNRTVKNRDGNAPEAINIKVIGAGGYEVFFKVKQTTQFKRLFEAYCQKVGAERDSLYRFLFEGERLRDCDTPADHGMEDEVEIEAMRQECGC